MKERIRYRQVSVSPDTLRHFTNEEACWYETLAEVRRQLAWGREKERLLRWVRRAMDERLTERERECVVLVFFVGLSYRQAGRQTSTDGSSVYRAVQRAVRRLRAAAAEEGVRMRTRRELEA